MKDGSANSDILAVVLLLLGPVVGGIAVWEIVENETWVPGSPAWDGAQVVLGAWIVDLGYKMWRRRRAG